MSDPPTSNPKWIYPTVKLGHLPIHNTCTSQSKFLTSLSSAHHLLAAHLPCRQPGFLKLQGLSYMLGQHSEHEVQVRTNSPNYDPVQQAVWL